MLYNKRRDQAKTVSASQKKQVSGKVLSTITFCSPKLFKHFYKLKLIPMQPQQSNWHVILYIRSYDIEFNALV